MFISFNQMRPDMKKFVFHLCWAPEKAQTEDVRIFWFARDKKINITNVNICLFTFYDFNCPSAFVLLHQKFFIIIHHHHHQQH